MEYIEADCTIVLGGVTLLELGVDFMEEESSLSQSRVVQMVQPIRADFAVAIPRNNVRNNFAWSRVKQFDSADLARQFKITHAAELPTAAGDCTLTYANGLVATLSNAVLASDCYSAKTKAGLFTAQYRISCGKITITTPAS